jgi:beta-phosphoglucomutase
MSVRELQEFQSVELGTLKAAILDVDGVPLAWPHEDAWREALSGFTDPNLLTTAVYLAHVAEKTRLIGARSALEALGVPDAARLAVLYAERKQKWLEYLIQDGDGGLFGPDPGMTEGDDGARSNADDFGGHRQLVVDGVAEGAMG